jgi:DNA repair exonuclease SbcCD ATPase subunit
VAHASGADTLGKLNADLLTLSIDTAELAARVEAVDKRLSALRELAPRVHEVERLQRDELPEARRKLHQAEADVAEQEQLFSHLPQKPPTITLLGPEQP